MRLSVSKEPIAMSFSRDFGGQTDWAEQTGPNGLGSRFCKCLVFPAIMGSVDCTQVGMTIFFYQVCEPYGCFSNFSPHSIELEGRTWPTTEHYYQAQKYVGTPDQFLCEQIYQAPSPVAAAALGRNPIYRIREDWDLVKVDVMYRAVRKKFMTHAATEQSCATHRFRVSQLTQMQSNFSAF
jgi:ribA/ribD-fused uncharacterized protein